MNEDSEDILKQLDGAWNEDHKMNLMHYCDRAGQEIRRLRSCLAAIQKATIEGRVCDDVAWFDDIFTLHDFCDLALNGPDPGHDKEMDARIGGRHAPDLLHSQIDKAIAAERERCATVVLEQRCERGTPWDRACVTAAEAIRALPPRDAEQERQP